MYLFKDSSISIHLVTNRGGLQLGEVASDGTEWKKRLTDFGAGVQAENYNEFLFDYISPDYKTFEPKPCWDSMYKFPVLACNQYVTEFMLVSSKTGPYDKVKSIQFKNGEADDYLTESDSALEGTYIHLKYDSKVFTDVTVREIHKFLRSAFNQAVKWELMTRNPVLNATLPKEEHQKREIWTAETLMHALEVCDDDILALAINLSFACSLRMGEMLGLTWDCIDISEESLRENNASIYVDKELQRVNRDVMEVLDNKDIIRVFPRTLSNTQTSLVLKTPKTKTSVRKIFLPSTVAQMLLERKKQIDEMKELFGDEYLDYNLVFCHSSGRPMEGQVINRALKKLIQDNDLPDVVFHSFRHASITYKLKWNGGDMKSVQGDSGHARMDMVADVYSHIIDEDRRYNAQKFEEQFYNAKGLKNVEEGKTAPMPKFETSVELLDPMAEVQEESKVEEEKPAENSTDENAALLAKLLSNPETAALLKALAKTI